MAIVEGSFARVDSAGDAVPTDGATVKIWLDDASFQSAVALYPPVKGTALPTSHAADATTTTGTSAGSKGGYRFSGLSAGDYWVGASYSTDDVVWEPHTIPASSAVADISALVFNVKAYGALGDGATDDTTAIAAAITACKAVGGTVFFPDGVYPHTGLTGLNASRGVTLQGTGGDSDAAHCAELRYTSSGSAAAIDARHSFNCRIKDLVVTVYNAAHTGRIIDFRGTGGVYTQMGVVTGCSVFAYRLTTPVVTHSCVDIDETISMEISNNTFVNTDLGIHGGYTFANSASILRNSFQDMATMCIKNAGEGWVIQGNTFQALYNAASPADVGAPGGISYTASAATFKGLNIIGNWFGDSYDSSTGNWIKLNAVEGCVISGNEVDLCEGNAGILFGENSAAGVVIQGNKFRRVGSGGTNPYCVNIASTTGHSGMLIGPNKVEANLDEVNGTTVAGTLRLNGTTVAINAATVSTTLGVTGATTLSSTAAVTGAADFASTVDLNSNTGGLRLVAASADRVHGTSALATGATTTVVGNTAVKTGATIIMLPSQAGFWTRDPFVSAISDATSFTVTHTNVASTPAFEYWIINPVA